MDLFEKKPGEEELVIPTPIDEETEAELAESESDEITDFTVDDIVQLIEAVNEEGHSESYIVASLDRLSNIEEGKLLDEYTEDDVENVDEIEIDQCAVDFCTFDGDLISVTLMFDTANDAYLRELNSLLTRYRTMSEDMMAGQLTEKVPMFSIFFAPKALEGRGLCRCTFPVMYTRCLADNGKNCSMLLMFHMDQIDFKKFEIDEETKTELIADAMREAETGTGGNIFE